MRLADVISAGQLATAYGVELVDYKRDSMGLGIANGCGSLLALMDARLDLRWALSLERLREPDDGLLSFLEAAGLLGIPIAVHMVFMVDHAGPALDALAALGCDYDYHCMYPLGGRNRTLEELYEAGVSAAGGPADNTVGRLRREDDQARSCPA